MARFALLFLSVILFVSAQPSIEGCTGTGQVRLDDGSTGVPAGTKIGTFKWYITTPADLTMDVELNPSNNWYIKSVALQLSSSQITPVDPTTFAYQTPVVPLSKTWNATWSYGLDGTGTATGTLLTQGFNINGAGLALCDTLVFTALELDVVQILP